MAPPRNPTFSAGHESGWSHSGAPNVQDVSRFIAGRTAIKRLTLACKPIGDQLRIQGTQIMQALPATVAVHWWTVINNGVARKYRQAEAGYTGPSVVLAPGDDLEEAVLRKKRGYTPRRVNDTTSLQTYANMNVGQLREMNRRGFRHTL